jgi:hypothetical protein
MTGVQKATVAGILAVSIGLGVYEAIRSGAARRELKTVREQSAPLAEELQRLRAENARVAAVAQNLETQNLQLRQQLVELPNLRAEVAALRSASPGKTQALAATDPGVQNFLEARAQAQQIQQALEQRPDKKIPELTLLTDADWLAAVKEAKFDSEIDIRKALSHLRSLAKTRLPLAGVLDEYLKTSGGEIPTDPSQLKPFLQAAVAPAILPDETLDTILSRYSLIQTGNVANVPRDAYILVEKAPVDKEYDSRAKFGRGRSAVFGTGLHEAGDPNDPSY